MLSLAVLSFVISLLSTLMVRRVSARRVRAYPQDAPQRFHAGHVPRLGSIGILGGWSLALLALPLLQDMGLGGGLVVDRVPLLQLALVLVPAYAAALLEDLTQRVAVRRRLLLTFGSAVLAWWLLGVSVPRLGFAWMDAGWTAWPGLGVALALLAVMGLPHAFNIIDGYNGLAGTMAIVVSLALAHVALQVGDRELAAVALALAAATGGFLVWNYPRGLIFAGDAGAYLWGVLIAVLSILLVQRHPLVSPWFPMLLLIYPVWETLFSIYRKLVRGESPGMADALHLHQLIYRRLIYSVLGPDDAQTMLQRNNRTTPYLWGFMALSVVPAVLFWRNSLVLVLLCLLFAVSYVVAYLMLVRFKVPPVFQRSRF